MGKLLIFTYFYIAIWSKEYEYEQDHIHVFRSKSKQGYGAKFFIDNDKFILSKKGDFSDSELNDIRKILLLFADEIKQMLIEHKKGKIIKAIKITNKDIKKKLKYERIRQHKT